MQERQFFYMYTHLYIKDKRKKNLGVVENSLVVQWLGLRAFTAEGPGSIPGWGTKILQATRCS